jgi:hypothetical protein
MLDSLTVVRSRAAMPRCALNSRILIQRAAVSLMKVNARRGDRRKCGRAFEGDQLCNDYRYRRKRRRAQLLQFKRGPRNGRIIGGTVSNEVR